MFDKNHETKPIKFLSIRKCLSFSFADKTCRLFKEDKTVGNKSIYAWEGSSTTNRNFSMHFNFFEVEEKLLSYELNARGQNTENFPSKCLRTFFIRLNVCFEVNKKKIFYQKWIFSAPLDT